MIERQPSCVRALHYLHSVLNVSDGSSKGVKSSTTRFMAGIYDTHRSPGSDAPVSLTSVSRRDERVRSACLIVIAAAADWARCARNRSDHHQGGLESKARRPSAL